MQHMTFLLKEQPANTDSVDHI